MEPSEHINEDERVPSIAGRRIDMFDVMAALKSSDSEEQLYETWELSEEQVEAAVAYIDNHEEDLLVLQEELTPDA